MSDEERRDEEAAALRAIFCEEGEVDIVSSCEWRLRLTPAWVPSPAILEIHLPIDYPSTSAPTPVLHAPTLDESTVGLLAAELLGMFTPGALPVPACWRC